MKTRREPEVSVLTSCYNSTKLMSEMIESILGQTFSNFEFILIDDGSTDGTFQVIQQYSRIDSRIVPISKTNTGLTDSLNVGASFCRGRWIARIDADDVAMPNRLEQQTNHLKKFPGTSLLGSACELIDAEGSKIKSYSWPSNHDKLICQLERGFSTFPHSSVMFDTLVFNRIGGYNRRFLMSQDCDLWLRFGERGEISCLPEGLIKLRKHSQQISSQNGNLTQKKYGMTARVCHFLRASAGRDPSIEDEAVWYNFLGWMEEQLHLDGFFSFHKFRMQVREDYYKFINASSVENLLNLTKSLIDCKLIRQIGQTKFTWSKYPRVLAERWKQSDQYLEVNQRRRDPLLSKKAERLK